MLPAIVKMLRTLKATEDATAEPASQSIYLLCDMALAVAAAIMNVHSPGATAVGKYPGSVVFPKGFFRLLDSSKLKGGIPSRIHFCTVVHDKLMQRHILCGS